MAVVLVAVKAVPVAAVPPAAVRLVVASPVPVVSPAVVPPLVLSVVRVVVPPAVVSRSVRSVKNGRARAHPWCRASRYLMATAPPWFVCVRELRSLTSLSALALILLH